MTKKLVFGSKFKYEIVLCDYCRFHKCDWIEATPQKHPDFCLKPKSFEIANEYVPKEEFERRVKTAKRIGTYQPEKKKWQFSIRVAKGLSGEELRSLMEEINKWSKKNNFKLTDMIRYEEPRWF